MAHKSKPKNKHGHHGGEDGDDAAVPTETTPGPAQSSPNFAQPQPGSDPTEFVIQHPTDNAAYARIDKLNKQHKLRPLAFPAPRGGTEPRLTLADIYGPHGTEAEKLITQSGQLVFHAVGDTGSTRGPESQSDVADKMVSDFNEADRKEVPKFFLHLGDVIYNFGEAEYYYDQFYDPYRGYPAPIIALAGNHDGMVAPGSNATTLAAFLGNFCAEDFHRTADTGGLLRTAQIQPGVFYTFEAPFLRCFVLYSNTLEDPGVISSEDGTWPEIGDSQLDYLEAALTRAKHEKFPGAIIIAHHHPAYTASTVHGWSIKLREEVDAVCEKIGLWPHAVLSGHAHNYQRFTRLHGDMQIPYIIAGNGGHAVAKLARKGHLPLRAPAKLEMPKGDKDQVVLESYDDQDYGYLRIVVTETQLRIEYHPATDGETAKTPDDTVVVDLATRMITPLIA